MGVLGRTGPIDRLARRAEELRALSLSQSFILFSQNAPLAFEAEAPGHSRMSMVAPSLVGRT
jgi:hypothetical protein